MLENLKSNNLQILMALCIGLLPSKFSFMACYDFLSSLNKININGSKPFAWIIIELQGLVF